ncbi:MAG: DUF1003 domain-containing protein [Desulfomonilaceae bacterium]
MKLNLPPSLEEIKSSRKKLRDVNKEFSQKISLLDRIAVKITTTIGTMGFFLLVFSWTILWLGWNLLAPSEYQFDPPMAFVFWLFISNVIQILLMPLIMLGQNILGRHAEKRAANDLEIDMQAEKEVEIILQHLEYQNAILIAMVKKLEVGLEEG